MTALTILCQNIYSASDEKLEFDYFGVEDGLPHSSVNDIVQDKYGYLWIATDDGLAKYDSYKFEIYKKNPRDSSSIQHNSIIKLFLDAEDNLWVGTRSSLELYNRDNNNFTHYYFLNVANNDSTQLMVGDINQENDSVFWICTDGGSLYRFNTNSKPKNTVEKYFDEKLEFSKQVSKLYKDKYGSYWIGTLDNGLFHYSPMSKKLKKIPLISHNKITAVEIRDIIKFSKNSILVGSYDQGVFSINIDYMEAKPYSALPALNKAPGNRVFKLYHDQDSNLWIGTDGMGLLYQKKNSTDFIQYKHHGFDPNSIGNDVIKSIYTDREGNIWIGHFLGGLSIDRKKNEFRGIKNKPLYENSLSHNIVSSIMKDYKNQIWIGTDGGGLNILANGKIYNENENGISRIIKGEIPNNILAIFEDNNKNIWLGTYLDGVFIYNPETKRLRPFKEIYPDLEIQGKDIRCFYQDRQNNIWIGTNGQGINILNTKEKTIKNVCRKSVHEKNTISLNWIRSIIEDKYGYVWIGTAYGLNRYDPIKNTFFNYFYDSDNPTSISDDFVYSIFEDCEHDLWIGTSNGLNKYNRQSDCFERFNLKEGLPNNIINAITEDKDSCLWLSTNDGISKFDKQHTFINFNNSDGLISNSFVNGAVFNDKNNNMYFGSIQGLIYFNPDKIQEVQLKVPIVFTDLKILNKSVNIGESYKGRTILSKHIANTKAIELSKKDYSITFEFTALSYAYPNKIKYEYKLDNFDEKWMVLNEGHSVSYTNLKSGSYTFHVRSASLGPNQPITSLDITFLPPFYETKWFIILIILINMMLLYTWNRKRIMKVENQKKAIEKEYEETKIKSEQERISLKNKMLEVQMKQHEAEMNLRNSQLISNTLLITNKNEIMSEIKTEINHSIKNIIKPEVKSEMGILVKRIDNAFKMENEWGQFEEHFNQVHKDFFTRLKNKYPDLTLTYLKLSAYLRLDLTTKEIASLMNISPRGVEKSRSRLRKKFDLEGELNLVQFISQI